MRVQSKTRLLPLYSAFAMKQPTGFSHQVAANHLKTKVNLVYYECQKLTNSLSVIQLTGHLEGPGFSYRTSLQTSTAFCPSRWPSERGSHSPPSIQSKLRLFETFKKWKLNVGCNVPLTLDLQHSVS